MQKIKFVTPVALLDVIKNIAPGFEQDTGHRLELSIMLNPEVPAFINGGAKWSLAASNPWHLEEIPANERGPIHAIGRSPLAFGALSDGGTHVCDEAQISDVLRRSKRIGVTDAGTSGGTFGQLLDRLKMKDEVQDRIIPLKGGEPMRQLLAGQLDLAVLPLTNIAPIRGVGSIAVCPWDFDVHIDLALCCHPKASADAQMFADWLMSNDRDETLEVLGLTRT